MHSSKVDEFFIEEFLVSGRCLRYLTTVSTIINAGVTVKQALVDGIAATICVIVLLLQ